MRRSILTALAGISALAMAVPGSAAVIVDGVNYNSGQSFQIFFNGFDGGGPETGLNATLTLTFNGVDGNGDYLFTYALSNDSNIAFQPFAELGSFGFNSDPNPNLAGSSTISTNPAPPPPPSPNYTDDALTGVSSGNIANNRLVDFCITAGPNCNGTSSGGPDLGETVNGTFVLAFLGADPGNVTLDNFHVRWQSTGLDGQGSATGEQIPGVPEPGTWALMLMGFAGAGFALRRRRRSELLQLA